MNTKKIFILSLILILVLSIIPHLGFSLPPDPLDCDFDPLDPRCPIDGGLSLLVAAGIGLTAYRQKRKRNR